MSLIPMCSVKKGTCVNSSNIQGRGGFFKSDEELTDIFHGRMCGKQIYVTFM